MVILTIALLAVITNFYIQNNANASSDQSIIFSFIKNHPGINTSLIATKQTSTINAQTDQLVTDTNSSSSKIVLASTVDNSALHTDPTTIQDDVAVKTNPADTESFSRSGITKYQVASGDTVIGIASSFGISPQTIMMENKISEDSILKPGQELTILPTTGITHTITSGDTLSALLKKYSISEESFLDANNIESFDDLAVGAVAVIPLNNVTLPASTTTKFVKDTSNQIALKQSTTPASLLGSGPVDFMWPTPVRTITQGFSSRHTGLDISDSKMEPIYAAADGYVEISGYQSNGYGNTIVINHGSGFKTRYGHASELYVTAGEHVTKGQLIAKQGHTGRVRGVTGIHLHFEIIKNGVRVNPLLYVKP
ncbi:MAG TPA: M23 family metallopeptidase [Methylomirabilota bacterium]|nr:M23 family metallopeptidase [Methylomirabilota bacterium]